MWDLNSQTRDRSHAPCSGNRVLTTGQPGKSQSRPFLKSNICVRNQVQWIFPWIHVKEYLPVTDNVLKHRAGNYSPWGTPSVFVSEVWLEHSLTYCFPYAMAKFVLWWQSWRVWDKAKIFTIWLFQKKFADLCSEILELIRFLSFFLCNSFCCYMQGSLHKA